MRIIEQEGESLQIAIVGGGIVGLVLAAGLVRRGIKVRLFEQAQGFREIGAGIAFTATAINCMGLIDPAVASALRLGGAVPLSAADEADGNDYLRWIDGYNQRDPDDPYYQKFYFKADAGYRGFEGIRRDQFLEELVKIFEPGVIECKKRLEGIEDRGGGEKILLKFRDGTTAEADAVIGCDGVKSLTRDILMGEGSHAGRPSYTHINSYRTLIPMDKAIKVLGEYKARIFHNHIGPGANLLHYPVANSTMVNVTAFIHDPNDWPEDKPTTLMGCRKDVQDAFVKWNPAVRDLVDLFPDQLHMWAVFDLWDYPIPFYNRNRICLAGDAAHATSPHHGAGAGIGIEDALCLSVLMSEVMTSIRQNPASKEQALITAFETYDKVRRTRSQWLVNSSRRMCDLHHQEEWGDPTKWLKAETCFEEIKDRSYKIWYFDVNGMVKESIEKYNKEIRGRAHGMPNGKPVKSLSVKELLINGTLANGSSANESSVNGSHPALNGTQPQQNGSGSCENGSLVNGLPANGSLASKSSADAAMPSANGTEPGANGFHPLGFGFESCQSEPSATVAPESIPTIDISAFTSPTASEQEKREVVEAVRHACATYGFFQLAGHGVPLAMQEGMLERTKRFFALPMEERMDVSVSKSMGRSFRGYEPPLIQTHHEGLLPDTKETFLVGAEVPADHPDAGSFSTGPNLWPKSLPDEEFKIPILEYQSTMLNLVKVILKILAQGLPKSWGCPPDVFDKAAENPSIPMRMLHYAPQPVRDERQFGVADHTDFGCVTILLQEVGSRGLEVWYPPKETWIPVPPQKGAYVINMSDMMQKWTGGYYRSARHRVISYSDKHRYSVAFFLNGNLKLNAKALDGSGREAVIGEHIRQRLIETLGKTGDLLKR